MKDKILNKEYGVLTYGITPPKASNSDEKIKEIAKKQVERISSLNVDGLIVYDVQDESDRTGDERPFEFESFVDPSLYANSYLSDLVVPKVVYRCVGNYDKTDFTDWLHSGTDEYTVFVGTSAKDQRVKISLGEAYQERSASDKQPLLGGVTIPERHEKKGDEPHRLERKVEQGCEYFISQCVYDVDISKKFLKDYKEYFAEKGLDIKPILFTLTPCGSERTLQFIKWLGIHVPDWVEKELLEADDMLAKSLTLIESFFAELTEYAGELGIPIGCNIESVSIRKVEIKASIQLAKDIRKFIENRK